MDLAVDVTLSQRADPGSGTNRDLDHFHMEILHLKSFAVNRTPKNRTRHLRRIERRRRWLGSHWWVPR